MPTQKKQINVNVLFSTYDLLKSLAEKEDIAMGKIIDKAVSEYANGKI